MILMFFVVSLSPVQSEREPWTCPNCGKTGNTRNFCGKCGQPAPENTEITSTYTTPGSDANVDRSITVWVSDTVVDFTEQQIKAFKAAHPEYDNYSFTVAAVSESIAAEYLISGADGGADVFSFAQDQLSQLVAAGLLEPVTGSNVAAVEAENDAGAVAAAKLGGTLYAYPMTSDNGFFLYYDQRIISDPGNLDAILAACKKAGKKFYMEITSGWYQTAFFFGAGCTLSYECDDRGNFVSVNCDYASEKGVKALKSLIKLARNPAFVNGSSGATATEIGAIVDGIWDSGILKEKLGKGYAASKLPSFDGFQMTSFGCFKLIGVTPQSSAARLDVCSSLAAYLTSSKVQLARYHAVLWLPSSVQARQDPSFSPNEAVAAFQAQLPFTTPQGLYPLQYWELATDLGNDILSGTYDHATDEDLLAALTQFQETAVSLVQ